MIISRKFLMGVCMLALTATAWADDDVTFKFTTSGSNATITGYEYSGDEENLTELTIPSQVSEDGSTYTVTAIGTAAIIAKDYFTKITIPSTVTSIGEKAFMACDALEEVTTSGEGGSALAIAKNAFASCEKLETVSLSNITSVGDLAFNGCSSLTSITLGSSTIGKQAFQNCTSLANPDLSKVTSIGEQAFSGCTKLGTAEDAEDAVTVDLSAATEIGSQAFLNCTGLTKITINGTGTIGTSAFDGCKALAEVGKASGVTSGTLTIYANAFDGCSALASVDLGNASSLTIGKEAFYVCTALTTVTFSESATSITVGESSFSGCGKLSTISLDKVDEAGVSAFYNCGGLTSIDLSHLTKIDENAFELCTGLTSISLTAATTISDYAFKDCSGLTEVTLPTTAPTTLGTGIFSGCTKLATVTNIDALTEIAESMFQDCLSLSDVELGSSLTKIDASAFEHCTSIAKITIPSSVTSIGSKAFYNCTSLAEVAVENATAATCADDEVFGNVADGCELTGSVDLSNYTDATGWKVLVARVTSLSISIGTVGYGTYYTSYEYTINDDNFEAGVITNIEADGKFAIDWAYGTGTYVDANGVTTYQSDVVPAGTAVVIRTVDGNSGSFSFDTQTATKTAVEGNYLHGSDSSVTADEMESITKDDSGSGDYYYYALSNETEGGLGFYIRNEDGSAFEITSSNKAWLAVPKDLLDDESGTKALYGFSLGNGGTTGIQNVKTSVTKTAASDAIYNMQGVKVNDMSQKGIYIVGGKKVIVK